MPADIVLDQITIDLIDKAWPLVEPLLQRGIEAVTTEQTTAAIRKDAEDGRKQLWAIYDRGNPLPFLASAATYLRHTNKGLVAVVDTIGGQNIAVWLGPVLDRFAQLAKSQGATRIEIEGRMGWAKTLPGFTPARIIMQKELR